MVQLREERMEVANGNLWQRLLQWHREGHLLGAGSPNGSDTDTSSLGIVQVGSG
jgi:hypothetical protein